MDILVTTQQVINELEANLLTPDFSALEKLVGMPMGLYMRMFGYLCDLSLNAYLRKRRLTCSAEDLLAGMGNVTDMAFKYGYDSSSAYTRAFKEQFMVAPSLIDAEHYRHYGTPKLLVHQADAYYVFNGKKIMADVVQLNYKDQEEKLLIGLANQTFGVRPDQLWGIFWEQGIDQRLALLSTEMIEMDDCMGLGYMTDFENTTDLGSTYLIGKYFKLETAVPEGLTGIKMPARKIVQAQISGHDLNEIIGSAFLLVDKMVRMNGYQLDYDHFYWIENYTISRFCDPMAKKAETIILDWEMPVIGY